MTIAQKIRSEMDGLLQKGLLHAKEVEEALWRVAAFSPSSSAVPSPAFITAMAHAGWGAIFILVASMFGLPVYVLWVAWVPIKEFVYDIVEEEQSWANSFIDFAQYLIGGVVALLLVLLSHLLHH